MWDMGYQGYQPVTTTELNEADLLTNDYVGSVRGSRGWHQWTLAVDHTVTFTCVDDTPTPHRPSAQSESRVAQEPATFDSQPVNYR